jgi:hypothetical protein
MSLLGRGTSRPEGSRGPLVFRWDLDKTYLQTEFDSLRGLVRIPFEKAADKVAAPGVAALIRGLRETARQLPREVRVYFISASPPQIGRAISEKLALDGIEYDGIVFKDQLHRLMRGKFRDLREQVGYKLTELLKAHSRDPPGAREFLFGDDWESDPLIYSLYADITSGSLAGEELGQILTALQVDPALRSQAIDLARGARHAAPVVRVFINLERRTPPARLRAFGGRLVPTFNYLQTAACLFEDGVLSEDAVESVARALREDADYSSGQLVNSLRDVRRRGHLSTATTLQLQRRLGRARLVSARETWRSRWRERWERWRQRAARRRGAVPVRIDYRALVGAAGEGSGAAPTP